jgi:hypothetical protein
MVDSTPDMDLQHYSMACNELTYGQFKQSYISPRVTKTCGYVNRLTSPPPPYHPHIINPLTCIRIRNDTLSVLYLGSRKLIKHCRIAYYFYVLYFEFLRYSEIFYLPQ